MAHSFDAVIPTIASRCQVVRFRRIPATDAAAMLVSISGADPAEAAMALAAAGGVVARARDFLASSPRREARAIILRTLKDLANADELEVLIAAKELLAAVKAPLEDVKALQSEEAAEQSDFLGKSGNKALEERHKRELTSREREGISRGAQRRRELASGLLGTVARRRRSRGQHRRFRRHRRSGGDHHAVGGCDRSGRGERGPAPHIVQCEPPAGR